MCSNNEVHVGATIILLRNINPIRGLCNGTHLIVRDLQRHVICAEIIANEYRGQYVMIPRITMSSQDTALPVNIARVQFPVRLAYCLTINKAQGQSLRYVGVDIPEPVFSHGAGPFLFEGLKQALVIVQSKPPLAASRRHYDNRKHVWVPEPLEPGLNPPLPAAAKGSLSGTKTN
eukprot:gene8803-biopygen9775